jgi:hypothetical protein
MADSVGEKVFAFPDFDGHFALARNRTLPGFGKGSGRAVEIAQGTQAISLLSEDIASQSKEGIGLNLWHGCFGSRGLLRSAGCSS